MTLPRCNPRTPAFCPVCGSSNTAVLTWQNYTPQYSHFRMGGMPKGQRLCLQPACRTRYHTVPLKQKKTVKLYTIEVRADETALQHCVTVRASSLGRRHAILTAVRMALEQVEKSPGSLDRITSVVADVKDVGKSAGDAPYAVTSQSIIKTK